MAYTNPEGMRNFNDPARLYGCDVFDNNGNKVGDVNGVWVDSNSGELEFVSVKTGWFLGRESIVPATSTNFDGKALRVPYAEDAIKKAPNYPAGVHLTPEDEERAYAHYGMHRSTTRSPTGLASRGQRGARTRGADKAEAEIPLHEERVNVRPETYTKGQVRLRKVVRTETVNVPVELQRETVEIERIPASQVRDRQGKAFKEEEITMTEREQRPVIEKTREVTGAVRASKHTTSTRETVKTSKRKEDVQVSRDNRRD